MSAAPDCGSTAIRRGGSLLILVLIALLLPAVFDYTARHLTGQADPIVTEEHFSIAVTVVMLLVYDAKLVYTLVTHRDIFASEESREMGDGSATPGWQTWQSIALLVAATAAIALEGHLFSGALGATASALGLSQVFIGVIVLALVGTASDLFPAAWFARQAWC